MNTIRPVHVAVLALGGFLGGATGSAMFARSSASTTPAVELHDATGAETTTAIHDLVAQIQALREELSASSSRRSTVDAATGAPADFATIQASMNELLAALKAAPGVAAVNSPSVAPVTRARNRLFPEAVGSGTEGVDFDFNSRRNALTLEHRLWTLEQLIAVYGMPDDVNANGGTLWLTYKIESSRYKIHFNLTSGAVTHVNVDGS